MALAEHFLEDAAGRPGDRQRPRAPLAPRSRSPARRRPTRSSAAARGPGSRRSPRSRGGTAVEAGVEDLIVMKTTRSRVQRASRATGTRPCAEADDRLMATKIDRDLALRLAGPRLRRDLRGRPGRRCSRSSPTTTARRVQTSIWIMARAILERHEEVDEVRMVLPNLHHWLVDLSPFGVDQRRRDLRRDDRAARAHRGDRAARRRLT